MLQVLTCDGVGGTEFMVATLVERAEPAHVAMQVVTLDAPGPIAERLARAGVKAAVRAGRVRLSCHLPATAEDVDRALAALT